MGQDKSHIKASFVQGSSSFIDAVGFGLSKKMGLLKKGVPLRIAYTLEENVWQGNVSIQLQLKDIE